MTITFVKVQSCVDCACVHAWTRTRILQEIKNNCSYQDNSTTVKPVFESTSIKQATCIKQASVLFPKVANAFKCTYLRQAPILRKHILIILWELARYRFEWSFCPEVCGQIISKNKDIKIKFLPPNVDFFTVSILHSDFFTISVFKP